MRVALCLFVLCLSLSLSWGFRVPLESDARPNEVPKNFFVSGKPQPDRMIALYIGLAPSNKEKLTEILHETANPSSPIYGKWWTKQEVDRLVAPSAETQQTILSWLTSENILSQEEKTTFESGIDTTFLTRKTVLFWELRCSVAEAEKLLGVDFFLFRNSEEGGEPIVRTPQQYTVPSEVAPALTIIGNVFRFPANLAIHTEVKTESPEVSTITPPVLIARYNVTVPPYNAKNVQAVASFLDQYYSESDNKDWQQNYFPNTDCTITKTVGDNDQSNPGVEAALDTQYIQFGNCSVTTWDYSTPGQTTLGNEPFLKWLIEVDMECTTSFCPYVFSISYGDYETTITDAYAASVDFEFQMISLTGRTFLAASGDGGVGCTDLGYGPGYYNCSYFNANFPTSAPHVVSVGATTTSTSPEQNWARSSGGFSDLYDQPSYQGDAVARYFRQGKGVPSNSFYNKYGRGFPDVGVAGTNFLVYWKGIKSPVDGTSASCPTMAAMLAMINTERLNANLPTLGFANPLLYSAWASNDASFTDVASGPAQAHGCCPVGFAAVDGWEPVCGLGAPNYGILANMALSSSFIPAFK